jgi:hypothetical protein
MALGISMSASACDVFARQYSGRFKITALGTFDGKEPLGSTVVGVRWVDTGGLANSATYSKWETRREGDALVRDLGPNGLLIGLWDQVPAVDQRGFRATEAELQCLLTPAQLAQKGTTYESGEFLGEIIHSPLRARVPVESWPILARLSNPLDIRTLELIKPHEIDEKIPGVQFDGFTVEVTDAPVSRGITAKLPFIDGMLATPEHQALQNVANSDRPLWANLIPHNFQIDR